MSDVPFKGQHFELFLNVTIENFLCKLMTLFVDTSVTSTAHVIATTTADTRHTKVVTSERLIKTAIIEIKYNYILLLAQHLLM